MVISMRPDLQKIFNLDGAGLIGDFNDLVTSLKAEPESATSISMSEVDAKIAAAEARTDTKFAEMMGELRVITQKLEHVEKSTSGIRLNIWLAAATAVGLVVGIFSWGTSMFGVGMDAQSIADQSAKNVVIQAEPRFANMNDSFRRMDKNYETLQQQMGVILTAVEAQKNPKNPIQNIPNQ
ncbi:hypothetical protein H9643_19010 [Ochrobactrum sp. Sa2BUA5]|nr:hypothetical protein [Ochrobactrum gallinarum]